MKYYYWLYKITALKHFFCNLQVYVNSYGSLLLLLYFESKIFLIYLFTFIYLAVPRFSCGMWDLVP